MTDEPPAVRLVMLGDAAAAVCDGDVCQLPNAPMSAVATASSPEPDGDDTAPRARGRRIGA